MNNKLDNGGGGAEILDEFARILFQVQLLPRRIIRSKTNWNELQQPEESPKVRMVEDFGFEQISTNKV